jgi:hypothetical protein
MADRNDVDEDRDRGDYDTHGDWGRQGSWGNFANRPVHNREDEWRVDEPTREGNKTRGTRSTQGTTA